MVAAPWQVLYTSYSLLQELKEMFTKKDSGQWLKVFNSY